MFGSTFALIGGASTIPNGSSNGRFDAVVDIPVGQSIVQVRGVSPGNKRARRDVVDHAAHRDTHGFERHFNYGWQLGDTRLCRERNLPSTLDDQRPPSRHAGGTKRSGSEQGSERNNLSELDSGHCRDPVLDFGWGRRIQVVPGIDRWHI